MQARSMITSFNYDRDDETSGPIYVCRFRDLGLFVLLLCTLLLNFHDFYTLAAFVT
jgi:hypothetical protein